MPDLNKVFLMGRLTKDPELRYTAGGAAVAGCRVDNHREAFFRGRIGRDNPVQLAQKRQTRGRLAIEKHKHDWKIGFLHAAIERLVIFGDLPGSEPLLSDQQNEGRRFGDFLGDLRKPIAPRAQALRREKYVGFGILAPERSLERLYQREVLRIVAQKPAPHSNYRVRAIVHVEACCRVACCRKCDWALRQKSAAGY